MYENRLNIHKYDWKQLNEKTYTSLELTLSLYIYGKTAAIKHWSLSKIGFFGRRTTFRHLFPLSSLQCLPSSDPEILRQRKDPITDESLFWMCVGPFIIKTYQKPLPLKLAKARFESVNHNILDKVCVIQVWVTWKKEFNGSRDFLWTRKVLLRENVEHSLSENVETTSVSARQKRRGEKTWVKECLKS